MSYQLWLHIVPAKHKWESLKSDAANAKESHNMQVVGMV